jgi:hypothetical protein
MVMSQGAELVDLVPTREPESTAKGENVVVTAPVVFASNPDVAGEVRLTLTIQQADYLQAQLQACLVTARVNARRKS